MDPRVINIGKDFHVAPAGRSVDDGPYSGQAFRDRVLIPALNSCQIVTIELDGTEGYGSSFLEEAFGGLVRVAGLSARELRTRLRFISDEDPSLVEEIWSYIDAARPEKPH